ncbi:MAG: RNA polymerase sigma factor [Lachnospiraceae bacterium]|jgi:RNA polymerase sigma-70 factor (ECF subfamily)|nr:RNA polymerase sigma factor [Lachnospiraceae bacterium]
MEDQRIVDLYWERNESAIPETAAKYGKYLQRISYQILSNAEDAEECVNDTYQDAWQSMPPHRPSVLSTFLGKMTRRISIDLWRKRSAEKRGSGVAALALEELEECVSGTGDVESEAIRHELQRKLNAFLLGLPQVDRQVFLCRYWYMDSISDIAKQFSYSESKIKSMLHRTRKKLRALLEKEGY